MVTVSLDGIVGLWRLGQVNLRKFRAVDKFLRLT